jgi:hypothetical protein
MGSGLKRKSNDVLRVNLPQKAAVNSPTTVDGEGGSAGGGFNQQRDINRMCPPAFDVRIKPKRPMPDNTRVTVEQSELFAMDEFVGKLSEIQLKTLTECGGRGIRYSGKVLNKDGKTYARFEQNIRHS